MTQPTGLYYTDPGAGSGGETPAQATQAAAMQAGEKAAQAQQAATENGYMGGGLAASLSPTLNSNGYGGIQADPYATAAATANQQAGALFQEGNQALSGGQPGFNTFSQNPTGYQSRQQLAQTGQQYGKLEQSLQNVANGGGPNVGRAVAQQGQDSAIAQAMSGAGARGGSMGQNLAAASGNLAQAGAAGAAARQQQVGTAQGGLGSTLAGQGAVNMAQAQTQNTAAQQQAALLQQQQQANQQQALGLYGQSANEQNLEENAIYGAGQQMNNLQNIAQKEQAIGEQQQDQELGVAGGVASTFFKMV
jgi:hypothetical protein